MTGRNKVVAAASVAVSLVVALNVAATAQRQAGNRLLGPQPVTVERYLSEASREIDGDRALHHVAHVYRGWRTSGGPWFNEVIDWLGRELEDLGYRHGQQHGGYRYWIEEDDPMAVGYGAFWDPKYASLEIVAPAGDHDTFDFQVNGFDPGSEYYPSHATTRWVMENIGSTEEAALNQRTRLARSSGFTDPIGVLPSEAHGVTAELVHIGQAEEDQATGRYTWTENRGASLRGRFMLATRNRASAYRLALQEGAAGILVADVPPRNNPVVGGRELFPETALFAGVPNPGVGEGRGVPGSPDAPLAFNISPTDERYLLGLIDSGPVRLRAVAIGTFHKVGPDRPLRTLVAEIPGGTRPDERILLAAHVQEPGANDNASGVGLQLELALAWKELIEQGRLPRPDRTITFLWGDEAEMVSLWAARYPDKMRNVRAGLVLDMVGQDPERCGGILRIEKTPDPSAVYYYGMDLLPGQDEPPMTDAYVRGPDRHSLWGRGPGLRFSPYPGFYLNDLYLTAGALAERKFADFRVGSNPWAGGSDHDPMVWYRDDDDWHPIPAVLTWHFTDYFYHTNLDTMDKVSRDELRNVGAITLAVGHMIASAGAAEGLELLAMVGRGARQRFEWERTNAWGHLEWASRHGLQADSRNDVIAGTVEEAGAGANVVGNDMVIASIDGALAQEVEILMAWAEWYRGAITSVRDLIGSAVTAEYEHLEGRNLDAVNKLLRQALEAAIAMAAQLRP